MNGYLATAIASQRGHARELTHSEGGNRVELNDLNACEGAATEIVGAGSNQRIDTSTTIDDFRAGKFTIANHEHIIAVAAIKIVSPRAAQQAVVTRATQQLVGTITADQRVITGTTGQGIITRAANEAIIASTSKDSIVTSTSRNDVVACTIDTDAVVLGAGGNGVVARTLDDHTFVSGDQVAGNSDVDDGVRRGGRNHGDLTASVISSNNVGRRDREVTNRAVHNLDRRSGCNDATLIRE